MAIGSSNVPLCCERERRGEVPPRLRTCDGASETEAPLNLWVAIWLCGVLDSHQDFNIWIVVPPLLPDRSDRDARLLGASDGPDRRVVVTACECDRTVVIQQKKGFCSVMS